MSQQLLEFISQELKKGRSEKDISQDLVQNGWDREMIKTVFLQINSSIKKEPSKPKNHYNKWKSLFWKIPLGFFIALLLWVIPNSFDISEDKIQDEHLQLPTLEDISNEDNSYVYFLELEQSEPKASALVEANNLAQKYNEDGYSASQCQNLIKNHTETINTINTGLEKPYNQIPELIHPETITYDRFLKGFGTYSSYFQAIRIKRMEIGCALNENKTAKATQEIIRTQQFIDTLFEGNSTLLKAIVGIVNQDIFLKNLMPEIRKSTLTKSEIRKIMLTISKNMNTKNALQKGLQSEYLASKLMIDHIETLKDSDLIQGPSKLLLLSPYHFQPNRTKRLNKELWQMIINNMNLEIEQKLERKVALATKPFIIIISPNGIGKMTRFISFGNFNPFFEQQQSIDLQKRFTLIDLALLLYEKENGENPDTLQDLIPQYLRQIPTDPFSEKPIQYNVKENILYGLGSNGTDEGGTESWKEIMQDEENKPSYNYNNYDFDYDDLPYKISK